ncbi:hypothetical protein [Phenylobacterium sp.]|uniref:hypothetical protein n=1 Tax=Phenylobacterium sp. TaxID=1871053 RepID=UPI0028127538|nr:hypothetical protein [Phenylobacterium sp.]
MALAFLAAAAAPTLLAMSALFLFGLRDGLAAAAGGAAMGAIAAALFGYLPMLALGVPLYILLRPWLRVRAWGSGLAGALVGSASGILGAQTSAAYGGDALAGALTVIVFAALGLVGGLAFWRVHEGGRRRETPHPSGSA